MTSARKQSETTNSKITVARKLHPEDISVGDDVALSEVSYQFPSFFWCGADHAILPPESQVRITFLPIEEPQTLKVKSICLPFVLCTLADGKHQVYDVRQVQLVRLDRGFAQKVRDSRKKKGSKKKLRMKNRKKAK